MTLFTGACVHHSSSASRPAATKPSSHNASSRKNSSAIAQGGNETGLASWYGDPYHGRRAASGEIFDKEKLTAAHRALPFETQVEVTNLTNGRSVQVRINDRGPFVDGRIIDLSEAAAREIDMVRAGVAEVSLRVMDQTYQETPPQISQTVSTSSRTILSKPAVADPLVAIFYAVEAGLYRERAYAETAASEISRRFGEARVLPSGNDPLYWRVVVGRRMTLGQAVSLAAQVAAVAGTTQVVIDRVPE